MSCDDASYEMECAECEVKRTVTESQLRQLLPHLRFDKRPSGIRGRGLLADYPPLALLAGDRLEPSFAVPDIGNVENQTKFPLELTFWRLSVGDKHGLNHRVPLFCRELGVSVNHLCLDVLHTVHLGIMQRYVCAVLWRMFSADVFNVSMVSSAC